MEQIIAIVKMVLEKGPEVIGLVVSVLSAVIALCLIIPGEQPEKALNGAVKFLSRFSKK